MQSRVFSKKGSHHFLSSLEVQSGDFVTVYVEPGDFPDGLGKLLGLEYETYAGEIESAVRADVVMNGAKRYRTGAAIFWSQTTGKYVVLPPYPIAASKTSAGKPDISVLRDMLQRRYVIGVALVAWGSYAIGVFDGDSLVEWKTGTGYIHKEHKKGGRSQKRFSRRIEEQKQDFLGRVANRIEEKFSGFSFDFIFFGGNRLILKPLIRECKYLQWHASKIMPRILNVRFADRNALTASLDEITKSVVFTF